jgi:hypothetical protein
LSASEAHKQGDNDHSDGEHQDRAKRRDVLLSSFVGSLRGLLCSFRGLQHLLRVVQRALELGDVLLGLSDRVAVHAEPLNR